jgi:4-amino-4-deoxy-L-arabinose transferase-like glycosyltransferase
MEKSEKEVDMDKSRLKTGLRRAQSSRAPRTGTPRTGLLAIILIAVVIRLWGLDFGLPQQFHPDEPVVVTRAEYGVASGDWDPKAFHWPSGQIYLLGAEYEIWFWTGKIMGQWDTTDPDFMAYVLKNPGGFYYLGRLTTLLFGVGCVWLGFILARRFMGLTGALIVAALLALNPIMVRHSRFITPDIPSEFFFLAALIFIDRLKNRMSIPSQEKAALESNNPERGTITSLAGWSAVLIGLGTGMKYPVAVLVIPLFAVILFGGGGIKVGRKVGLAIGAGAIALLTFIATTPFAVLDFQKFITDLATISWHVKTGHIGMEAVGGIWQSIINQLLKDNGQVWTGIGVIGALFFLFIKPGRTWPMIIAFLLVVSSFAPLQVFSDRYLVPLIPFLALGLGLLIEWVVVSMEKGKAGKWASLVAVAIVLVIGVQGAWVTYKDAHQLTLPDTRTAALDWVVKNIPPWSLIVEEQGGPNLSPMELAPLAPEPTYRVVEITPLFFRGGGDKDPFDVLIETRPSWVISSNNVKDRYMTPEAKKQFPDLVAAFGVYYSLVENYMTEEAVFKPGANMGGPEIRIYHVPEGLWDRLKIEEKSVEDVEGGKP